MSDESTIEIQTEFPAVAKTDPVCPHCGDDPMRVSLRGLVLANIRTAIYFCGNPDCRKVISMGALPEQKPIALPGITQPFRGFIQ